MSSAILNESGERLDYTYHTGSREDVIVILGHGVTGNKDRPLLIAMAEGLSMRGWPCLRFSFSGNGDSEGQFEEATISKELGDLKSVLAVIPQEKRIAYIGHSMGAAVGVKCASEGVAIRALISLAGMIYTKAFAQREFGDVKPGEGFMWEEEGCPLSETFVSDMDQIDNLLTESAGILVPWLLIHGSEDDVVPISDSRDGYAVAKCEKTFVEIEGAGHSFDARSYDKVIDAIDAFLIACFPN